MSSLLRAAKAVAWSFIGIRKRSDFENDLGSLNPLHIIAVALLAVLLLVVGMIALVHWVAQ